MTGIEFTLLSGGGVWHLIAAYLGEWPTRSKEGDYELEWIPLSEALVRAERWRTP